MYRFTQDSGWKELPCPAVKTLPHGVVTSAKKANLRGCGHARSPLFSPILFREEKPMTEKQQYFKPALELRVFATEDVLRTSTPSFVKADEGAGDSQNASDWF